MKGSDSYATLEGVTTFRGSNYRDGGAYGTIPDKPTRLAEVWEKRIHGLDEWSGVGWTGQASVVRWPADLRAQMNINRAKKAKDGLVEVIYATLDGHIYFLDLDDGQETRKAINIGAPIKGSLAVDPRGVPLLYCGQGIYDVGGKRVACGTRIWSLIDQQQLYFLDGKDPVALRGWRAFDCSPLVDGDTDTMITAGENGVLYKVKLNTRGLRRRRDHRPHRHPLYLPADRRRQAGHRELRGRLQQLRLLRHEHRHHTVRGPEHHGAGVELRRQGRHRRQPGHRAGGRRPGGPLRHQRAGQARPQRHLPDVQAERADRRAAVEAGFRPDPPERRQRRRRLRHPRRGQGRAGKPGVLPHLPHEGHRRHALRAGQADRRDGLVEVHGALRLVLSHLPLHPLRQGLRAGGQLRRQAAPAGRPDRRGGRQHGAEGQHRGHPRRVRRHDRRRHAELQDLRRIQTSHTQNA